MKLKEIKAKPRHNYYAFFLTFACVLNCSYCINAHNLNAKRISTHMSGQDWIKAVNRLVLRDDLPLTLQGGEPTIHKDFYMIVNDAKPDIKMDLMTNLTFDVDEFVRNVPIWRFTREAPYAAIRVSYHPTQNDIEEIIQKTLKLQSAGFRIGVYGIEHPDESIRRHIYEVKERCLKLGIDFRTKEFLGNFNNKLYGTYKYDNAVNAHILKKCRCKTTELLVDPAGYVYRCHSDLYKGRNPIAHVLDEDFDENQIDVYRGCDFYGDCNPCDVKVKTNRFQIFGHTSVDIVDIHE